jgi:hypothetical protein
MFRSAHVSEICKLVAFDFAILVPEYEHRLRRYDMLWHNSLEAIGLERRN